ESRNSIPAARARRSTALSRLVRRVGVAALIVVALLGLAWLSRSALVSAVAGPFVRRTAGLDASWTRLELRNLSHLEIDGLRLRAARPGNALRPLDADHVEVEIDARKL